MIIRDFFIRFDGRTLYFLTKSFKTELFKMESLGETIRKRREDKELPLRTVAAYLDIDQAILSKIERVQRNANHLGKFYI